jgi:hypothetical protein
MFVGCLLKEKEFKVIELRSELFVKRVRAVLTTYKKGLTRFGSALFFFSSYFTEISSTSNISTEFGGIPGLPDSP